MYLNISKTRNSLMGIAMIMIVIFHTSIKYPYVLDLMKNFGDFGVNIFFLVSGFSMYFAWKKTPNVKAFYVKRFSRILITYWPIAIVWCSISVMLHECDIVEAICKILTIQFWIDSNLLHWFVSGILVLYLITPIWMKLHENSKKVCAMVTICICVLIVVLAFMGIIKRTIFMYRVPTYFMGLYMGMAAYDNHQPIKMERKIIDIVGVLGILFFALIQFDTQNYTWKYILYLLLSPAMVVWLSGLLSRCENGKMTKILTFCSTITLETYLLHEKVLKMGNMVLTKLGIKFDTYNIVLNIIGIIITIIGAYIYNQLISKIIKKVK